MKQNFMTSSSEILWLDILSMEKLYSDF